MMKIPKVRACQAATTDPRQSCKNDVITGFICQESVPTLDDSPPKLPGDPNS